MQAMPGDTNAGKTRKKKNKRKSNIKEKIEGKKTPHSSPHCWGVGCLNKNENKNLRKIGGPLQGKRANQRNQDNQATQANQGNQDNQANQGNPKKVWFLLPRGGLRVI